MTEFNPFAIPPREPAKHEILINDFAAFLLHKAESLAVAKAEGYDTFTKPEALQWLLDEIFDIIDEENENWSKDDVARLSAMFFFLLTKGE